MMVLTVAVHQESHEGVLPGSDVKMAHRKWLRLRRKESEKLVTGIHFKLQTMGLIQGDSNMHVNTTNSSAVAFSRCRKLFHQPTQDSRNLTIVTQADTSCYVAKLYAHCPLFCSNTMSMAYVMLMASYTFPIYLLWDKGSTISHLTWLFTLFVSIRRNSGGLAANNFQPIVL